MRLDKTQQCSDWARRPLEQEQFVYAALDAHILLQVYEALLARGLLPAHVPVHRISFSEITPRAVQAAP